jgi:preprotein translocase subunit YajC
MSLNSFATVLALGSPAQPGTQTNPTAQMIQTLGMFAVMGLMFYFLLIRPQSKKAKEQAAMLSKLKAGDKVVTGSGLVAIVVGVKDKTVSIRSGESKLEVLKSAITEITEVSTES